MQDYVLYDLEAWLKDPARKVPMLSAMNSKLLSESASQAIVLKGLESRVNDLEIELSLSRNIIYVATFIAMAAVILTLLMWRSYVRV
jgi:hypothetical protein